MSGTRSTSIRRCFPIAGVEAKILDRTALALHLALHATHHERGLGKVERDLDRALQRFDPEIWRAAAVLAERLTQPSG